MPLESAVYISDLDPASPAGSDPVAQGDDHLRLIKSTLKATFPNVTGPVTLTQGQLNSPFVAGMIMMYTGEAAPAGWALCDGTQGTPDLRGLFVRGASPSEYPVGTLGQAQGVTSGVSTTKVSVVATGSHSHAGQTQGHVLTVQEMPPHTHPVTNVLAGSQGTSQPGLVYGTVTNAFQLNTLVVGNNQAHSHPISSDGFHSHSLTDPGHTHTVSPIPPYYALSYIMKL